MSNLGIIVEGGGFRGTYAAGVLDFFLDHNIEADALFGVSAGILHGSSFISKQKSRGHNINKRFINDKRYFSLNSLIKTGDLFNADFCYTAIPNKLDLFDNVTFMKSKTKCYAVVSNLETGKAEYRLCKDMRRDICYVRASASLPLVSRTVIINGRPYLDGGVCDSIPIEASIKKGYDKNIVILTQIDGYTKKPNRMMHSVRLKYRKYPKFCKAIETRHLNYNNSLKVIKEQEKAGNAFVFRPSRLIKVPRIAKDFEKIDKLYKLGYNDAVKNYPSLKKFLEQCDHQD